MIRCMDHDARLDEDAKMLRIGLHTEPQDVADLHIGKRNRIKIRHELPTHGLRIGQHVVGTYVVVAQRQLLGHSDDHPHTIDPNAAQASLMHKRGIDIPQGCESNVGACGAAQTGCHDRPPLMY